MLQRPLKSVRPLTDVKDPMSIPVFLVVLDLSIRMVDGGFDIIGPCFGLSQFISLFLVGSYKVSSL